VHHTNRNGKNGVHGRIFERRCWKKFLAMDGKSNEVNGETSKYMTKLLMAEVLQYKVLPTKSADTVALHHYKG